MSLSTNAPRFNAAQAIHGRFPTEMTAAKNFRFGMIVAVGFSASVWTVMLATLL